MMRAPLKTVPSDIASRGELWQHGRAHNVLDEDLLLLQSGGFGIHHIVFRDNIGGEGFHADKPASKPNQHQGGDREHGMLEVGLDKRKGVTNQDESRSGRPH